MNSGLLESRLQPASAHLSPGVNRVLDTATAGELECQIYNGIKNNSNDIAKITELIIMKSVEVVRVTIHS